MTDSQILTPETTIRSDEAHKIQETVRIRPQEFRVVAGRFQWFYLPCRKVSINFSHIKILKQEKC